MMSDDLARAVLDALPDATAVLDPAGTIVDVNQAWLMFAVDNGGQPESTGLGVNYLDLCARSAASGCQDAARVADGLRAVLAGHTVHSELEYPCPSPAVNRWFLLRITPLAAGARRRVTSHVNITRRKMAEQELAHQAAHDPLTGLANRSLFANRLKTALTSRRGPARYPGGADVPGRGRVQADQRRVRPRRRRRGAAHHRAPAPLACPAAGYGGPAGGDEFAVTAPRISAGGLDGLCGRVTAALSQPHLIHGHLVPVPVSIGIHLAAPGESADTALRQADQAMYVAKRRTR